MQDHDPHERKKNELYTHRASERSTLRMYRVNLPEADPSWPYPILRIWDCVATFITDPSLNARDVLERCGIVQDDIREQFRSCTGRTIEALIAQQVSEMKKLSTGELSLLEIAVGPINPQTYIQGRER